MFAPKPNPLDTTIRIYRSFLDDYLKGDESEKERFVNILTAAYYYFAEPIDIRKIDNTQFDIINYLLTNYGHEIKSLDINNLQKADFVWLRNVFDDYFNHDDEPLLSVSVANDKFTKSEFCYAKYKTWSGEVKTNVIEANSEEVCKYFENLNMKNFEIIEVRQIYFKDIQ